MSEAPFDVQRAHRWFAVELNNWTWELLESTTRSEEETERMIHGAHAACYHWLHVGTVDNHQRALVLLANVYAAINDGPSALRHAGRCLQLTEANPGAMEDWDVAFAYDCLARAHGARGAREAARHFKQRAREAGDRISDPEDKRIFDEMFAGGNWHGLE